MDLSVYYQKLREAEARIPEENPVIVSCETSDGGKDGVKTEASRRLAAKLMLANKARLATEEEAAEYRESVKAARQQAQEAEAAARIQVRLLTQADLDAMRPSKGSRG